MPYVWDASLRRILIEALDVAPTYRVDVVQASVGWPLVELTLQAVNAPVILTGISVSYDPLMLGERRGG